MGNCGKHKNNCGCGCGRFIIRDFCIQQFPFLAEDFDALTTWELLQKVICYLKQVHQFTEEMERAYKDLVQYVEDTLGNLDDIVGDILQEMYEDGRITELIDNLFLKITELIDNLFLQMEDRCKKIVYVNCYGAKGDGVTDDTQAIQKAINENPNATFIFYGKYIITDTIIIKFGTQTFLLSDILYSGPPGKPAFKFTNPYYADDGKANGGPCMIGGCISGVTNDSTTMDCAIQVCTTSVRLSNIHVRNYLKYGILLSDNFENPRENPTNRSSAAIIDNCIITNYPTVRGSAFVLAHTDIKISNCNINGAKHGVDYYGGNVFISNTHITPTVGSTAEAYDRDAYCLYVHPNPPLGNMDLVCDNCYFNGAFGALVYCPETTGHQVILNNCSLIYASVTSRDLDCDIIGGINEVKCPHFINELNIRGTVYTTFENFTGYTGSYKDYNNYISVRNSANNPPNNVYDIRHTSAIYKPHIINSPNHRLQAGYMRLIGKIITPTNNGFIRHFTVQIASSRFATFDLVTGNNNVVVSGKKINYPGNIEIIISDNYTIDKNGNTYNVRDIYIANLSDEQFDGTYIFFNCDSINDNISTVFLYRTSASIDENYTVPINDNYIKVIEQLNV